MISKYIDDDDDEEEEEGGGVSLYGLIPRKPSCKHLGSPWILPTPSSSATVAAWGFSEGLKVRKLKITTSCFTSIYSRQFALICLGVSGCVCVCYIYLFLQGVIKHGGYVFPSSRWTSDI